MTFDPHQTLREFRAAAHLCTQTANEDLGLTKKMSFECGPNGYVRITGISSHNAQPGDMVSIRSTVSAIDQSGRPMNWTGVASFDAREQDRVHSGNPLNLTMQYPVS